MGIEKEAMNRPSAQAKTLQGINGAWRAARMEEYLSHVRLAIGPE